MKILVVPSAKLVGLDLQLEYGAIPPVLVPLRGTVALQSLIDFYVDAIDLIYVLADEGASLVEEYLSFFPHPKVEVVRVRSGRSLADSIEDFVRQRPEAARAQAVINLGDTVIDDLDHALVGSDFYAYDFTQETQRWTLFRKNNEGGPLIISDKRYQADPNGWRTFLGAWGFRDFEQFLVLLANAAEDGGIGRFYGAVRAYAQEKDVAFVRSERWTDYGHLDNLNAARRRVMNTRFFNSMTFGHGGATVQKRSRNTAKLADEIRWMLGQPDDLRVYLPAIYSHSLEPTSPYIEMEFYSYPSLDECFVYARHDFDTWEKIFARVFEILALQRRHLVEGDLSDDLREMYLNKTTRRIQEFIAANDLAFPVDRAVTINGVPCLSLSDAQAGLEDELVRRGALTAESFGILHGDLCFGNVLFDARYSLLKLIDPRGSFGRHALHGDVYYDLAKLSHSVLGLYDFIVFNQFHVLDDGDGQCSLSFRARGYHETIGEIFRKHVAQNGYDLRRVRLIESTLFLSMPPLHGSNPQHQLAMLLRGLQLFTEAAAT
ncbi:MAG: hypothetical protein ABI612_00330 [Betaproteobacteria bacterium]